MISSMARFCGNAVLDLIYPPFCFSCGECLFEDKSQGKIFCQNCQNQLEFVSYSERCPKCFEKKESHRCSLVNTSIFSFGCFEKISPVKKFADIFKEKKSLRLAETIASFILLQIDKLDIPDPNLISFLPLPWQERIFFDNLDACIAKKMAHCLKVPFEPIFKASYSGNLAKKEICYKPRLEALKYKGPWLLVSLEKREKEEWPFIVQGFEGFFPKKVYFVQFII